MKALRRIRLLVRVVMDTRTLWTCFLVWLFCVAAGTGCLTSQVYDITSKRRGGVMTLPKSSDALSAPESLSSNENTAAVPVSWNWPAFFLSLPVTLAWDVVTCPAQMVMGCYPYGYRYKP